MNSNMSLRLEILEILNSFPNSKIWDFFEQEKVIHLVQSSTFNMKQLISLYGFITIFFRINNVIYRRKMKKPNEPFQETNQGSYNKVFLEMKPKNDLRFEGYIDEYREPYLSGWAWSQQFPNLPLKIEVCDNDNNVISVVDADRYRGDLQLKQKGNGKHGFRVAINHNLIPKIRVRVAESDFFIRKSEKFASQLESLKQT